MATVHRATVDIGIGVTREVALKRLLPEIARDPMFIDDFVREAKLVVQLDHPNIVKLLELGRIDGTYYIAMELVRGRELETLASDTWARGRRLPTGVVLSLLVELCDALDYASTATDLDGEPLHVVHRDVSPSNLLVTDAGHLKMIDFGIARTTSGRFSTDSGHAKGKPGYMAIEALASPDELDPRTDIFSVGVVAWELLTGRRLFDGDTKWNPSELVVRRPSEYEPAIHADLDEIVMVALAADREERWQSAGAMRNALETVGTRLGNNSPFDVARWVRDHRTPSHPTTPRVGTAITRRQARFRVGA
jgi:serine/threonine protein kinase